MKKEIIYFGIIFVLIIALLIQIVGFPTTNYGEDRECIKWSKPIPNKDGNGNWRYCLKTISIDNQDFQEACYWSYGCDFISDWRDSLMGIPRDCIEENQTFSYWGNVQVLILGD